MPWKAFSVLDTRREVIRLAQSGEVSTAALCRRFCISRQTGFTLLRRHREQGDAGLADQSRRPRTSPRQVPPGTEAQILALRAAHPAWGGRKLARRLRDLGVADVPAPSTITEVLRRAGRIDPAEAARHKPFTRFEREAPNDLWQIDFNRPAPGGQVVIGAHTGSTPRRRGRDLDARTARPDVAPRRGGQGHGLHADPLVRLQPVPE